MEPMSQVTKALPFVAMIVVEFAMMGSSTLTKAALSSGLSQYVFIVYYDGLGTIILLPWFLSHCLSGKRLPLNFSILCKLFGLSLIGRCVGPIFYYRGLSSSSVTLGSSIGNITPIFTYLLAICLRMERLDLMKSIDQIKMLGTVLAVLGAFVVTLYKGPALLATHQHDSSNYAQNMGSEQSNWPLGGLFFTLGCLLKALWVILQADTAKLYPDEVTIVFFNSLFGSIQTAFASLFMVEGQNAWLLRSKIQIISVVYAAFSLSVLTNTILTWCLRTNGPVFVCMFDPLGVAIAAFMGFVFLHEGVYLGSVIGSAAIIVGFYGVMWGRAKTTVAMAKKIECLESASSASEVIPLLQSSHT